MLREALMLSYRTTIRRCEIVCFCKEFQVPIDLFHCAEWLNKLFWRPLHDKFNDLRNVSLNKSFYEGRFFCFGFILSMRLGEGAKVK